MVTAMTDGNNHGVHHKLTVKGKVQFSQQTFSNPINTKLKCQHLVKSYITLELNINSQCKVNTQGQHTGAAYTLTKVPFAQEARIRVVCRQLPMIYGEEVPMNEAFHVLLA